MRPTLVAIGGLSSEVGKTTLLCKLLPYFEGWEAIKITRGHHHSCGREVESCCVSPLLADNPLVMSGRDCTFEPGKDTGRYWEAGAANVHWVIATTSQVEEGLAIALSRVTGNGVFVEGNSFLRYVTPDYSIMVANPNLGEIKSSALRVMPKIKAVYIHEAARDARTLEALRSRLTNGSEDRAIDFFFEADLPVLAAEVLRAHGRVRG